MLRAHDKIIDNFQTLPAALKSYIPKQLLKNVEIEERFIINGVKYVQEVLDDSNDNLRMYGSVEELLGSVNIYMEFPLSRKMFPREMGSYCYTIPSIYQTLKKEVLYCKQDFLFYLQSCVYRELGLCEDAQLLTLKLAELIDYMKNHEKCLSGCYEFVKYDHDIFEDIRKPFLFAESLYVFQENAEMAPSEGVLRAVDCDEIQEKDFVKVFENLISKYPCLFLPNSETRDRHATAVVRIFDDGGFKFVMESELFAAINLKNPDQKPLECMDVKGRYRTIEYKHVLERYRDQIGDIDFIYHLIPFGLHAAVPIVAPTGDHCIQAVDGQMDIITETFFAGIFQKITQNTCHMIPKFIAILRKYFPSSIKYRYFINLKLFQKLREELEEFWKPIEDKPAKRVRNVGPQGFTVEDLIKELKYLGYTKIFPEITAAALAVYTVFHSQKPSELDTSDMYRSIQSALVLVLTKRYPCLNEFMFRQKVCLHNRRNPCDFCLKTIKEAEARIEAEIKAETEQAPSPVTTTTSEDDVEKAEDSEEFNPESVTNEAPSVAINNPVEAESNSIPAIFELEILEHNPILPDSNSHICEKCMETSNQVKKVDETYRKMMSQVKEHNEQLAKTEKALEERERSCKELEKAMREELLEVVMAVNKEKDNIETLKSQLLDKDKEIDEWRIAMRNAGAQLEAVEKLKQTSFELVKKVNVGLEQLKMKDSKIQELELKNSKLTEKKNQEIEKLKKQQALAAKEHKKEMEQLKRNASESADELKKLTAKIAENEAAENLLKRSNRGLLEKLQKFESSLKEVTNKRAYLESEIAEKNRTILELQKSAENQVSEQERTRKEHETRISRILAVCNEALLPEPNSKEKPDTECLICLDEMRPDQKKLKCEHCRKIVHLECASEWLKKHRSCAHCRREQLDPNETFFIFNVDFPVRQPLKAHEKSIDLSNNSEEGNLTSTMLRAQDKYIDDFTLLPAVLRRYIPKQLLKNVEFDKCHAPHELDFVQKVLDNSNDNLRMYGSAESLLRNLKVYMDFPLRRKMFSLGVGSYYHTIPDIYQTLKKEVLYCKQDLLFYLQSCVHKELRLYENRQKLKFAELIDHMKKHEERLSGCYEFVKYDDDIFEDIRKSFLYAESLCVFPKNAEVTATFGAPQIISYEEKDFFKVFDNLISKYPCFFLSNSETGTINFKIDSLRKLLQKDKNATAVFICHLIPFGLHAAVPIVTPTGDHCIQAVDAYMDIITETFITGIFQKITQNTSHMIPKFFGILRKYFPPNIKYRFFINLKLFQKIQEELEEFWKPIEDKPGKRVRNVPPGGFTVEDLKKELKYLGYNKIFPEIIGDARGAYTIFHSQKPSELKTKDMFIVIQSALTFILIKRNPCLTEFMCRQKVCLHNRNKPCEPCSKAIKEAEARRLLWARRRSSPEARIEAEIKAESEQASSSVTATTSGDDVEKEESLEASKPESVTNEAPSIVKSSPENLKKSVEASFAEAETKPIPAISEPEVSDHNPVLSSSNNHKMSRESFSKATKESEFEQALSKQSKVTSVAPSAALNNPVGAETNPLPANSESKVPEHDPVLPDYNTHVCEKCMETSNEAREEVKQTYRKMISQAKKHNEQLELTQKAREEVVETYRKMVVLEKTLKEKDAELKRLKVYEEK
ncbi:unnamed protein product [Caenorhabditis brenneri]